MKIGMEEKDSWKEVEFILFIGVDPINVPSSGNAKTLFTNIGSPVNDELSLHCKFCNSIYLPLFERL